jgi:hypothetical protein
MNLILRQVTATPACNVVVDKLYAGVGTAETCLTVTRQQITWNFLGSIPQTSVAQGTFNTSTPPTISIIKMPRSVHGIRMGQHGTNGKPTTMVVF